ncbi:hypothetical protein PybrP1_007240 [[Pythium] brassicae (nom. inval.)]|nr:hypothetical protein PybrP1_007240 [[Pythium] brassicae (nom. inval.)]
MWTACRLTALQQLRRSRGPIARAVAASAPQSQARAFTHVAGVERDFLLSRSAKELRVELGVAQVARVQRALGRELDDVLSRAEGVVPEDVKDLFAAAQKTKATPVMLRAFDFMQEHFPNKVDFAMLGEVFRLLLRARDGAKMVEVYESTRTRFPSAPEMVYRFGIVGNIELGELEAAAAIWQQMLESGHATPNEVSSRLMQAYARAGDRERALEIFGSVDPQVGQWHESSIDRVILSLGVLKEPQMAFDFYVNSSMKLNGGTLMALLSVCVNNNCHQQAADILANRKRFDLQLDARAYNRILVTLEFLGHHSEILDVLEEMKAGGVRFDSLTRTIIKRNLEHLEGTSFAAESAAEPDDVARNDRQSANRKSSGFLAAPRIRELLKLKEGAQAAALVDEFVKPLTESDLPEGATLVPGALKVPPFLAKDAVSAYIMTGEHEKVAALLQTFSSVEGNFGHALAEIMVHYGAAGPDKNEEVAYAATKALLFQGRQIFRVDDALMLFRKFQDVESTKTLFEQVIDEFVANKQEQAAVAVASEDAAGNDEQQANPPRRRSPQSNIGRVINMTLQTFVENRELEMALGALEHLDSHGMHPNAFNYAVVFSAMRDQNTRSSKLRAKKPVIVYSADQFERVWEGMRRRDVAVNKSIVGNVCAGLGSGNKRQRLLVLEAYADATKDTDTTKDKYVLPPNCYTILLQLTAQEGTPEELNAVFEQAVQSLGESPSGRVQRDWVATLVTNLTVHGEADAAHALFMQMKEQTGSYAYDTLITVLRTAAVQTDRAKLAQLFEVLEANNFRLNLQDSYELVHVARDTNQPLLALDVMRAFEAAHVNDQGELRDVKIADGRNAFKLRTMYRVALNVCENNGQWKHALQLRERAAKLLGEDAVADRPRAYTNAKEEEPQPSE